VQTAVTQKGEPTNSHTFGWSPKNIVMAEAMTEAVSHVTRSMSVYILVMWWLLFGIGSTISCMYGLTKQCSPSCSESKLVVYLS